MRVIITARQSLIPSYRAILERLVAIIGETSKNPSNPKFNQYNFESISALTRYVLGVRQHPTIPFQQRSLSRLVNRYVCSGQPDALGPFEEALFVPIQAMLSNDVVGKFDFILHRSSTDR